MKKLLLSILLMCYAVVMFKPVLPFISDFIGHVFFYTQHMATVHYENGNYHVHYETAKDVKEEKSDKLPSSSSSKNDTTSTEHILSVCKQDNFFAAYSNIKYSSSIIPSLISGISKNNYPPPRC
jgi:hypothetical protein